MRHLDIGVLRLQEQQLRRIVKLTKVLGTKKPAGLMTNHLAQELVAKYATALGYSFRGGRATTTAQLHTVSEVTEDAAAHAQGDQAKGELPRARVRAFLYPRGPEPSELRESPVRIGQKYQDE